MADKILTQQQAKATLLKHLGQRSCAVAAEKQDTAAGECLTIKSPSGSQHKILIQLLNLDEARSIKIVPSTFNYEPRENDWILLVLYMDGMEPLLYLIPTMVFATPSDIFISNVQRMAFRHLSSWEIKVFRNGIQELSRYVLDTAVIL